MQSIKERIIAEYDEAMKKVKLTLVVHKENKEWCALCGFNPDDFRAYFLSSLTLLEQETIKAEHERLRGEIEKKINHFKKLHDENWQNNTLIAHHADSCLRTLTDILNLLK